MRSLLALLKPFPCFPFLACFAHTGGRFRELMKLDLSTRQVANSVFLDFFGITTLVETYMYLKSHKLDYQEGC